MRYPKRSLVAAIHDMVAAAISLPLALYLRLGDAAWYMAAPYFMQNMVVFVCCFMLCMYTFRLQREVWRYVSINELTTLAKVVTISIILTYAILFFTQRLENVPRSLPILHWLILGASLSIPRVMYRLLRESGKRLPHAYDTPRVHVLLAGANNQADSFIRNLQRQGNHPYYVVGIIDQKETRHGRTLRGVPIYSGEDRLKKALLRLERRGRKPQRLILTEDYMDNDAAQPLLTLCESEGIGLAHLPPVIDLHDGITDSDIRPVAIEDLLGRSQSTHDCESMRQLISQGVVLVTGAGGSIGSELVRQIASYSPKQLILLEQSEYNLYQIDKELQTHFPDIDREALLCDVRDTIHIEAIFSRVKPTIVFHAAALKHVPLAELNPQETILTNVFGTRNLVQAAGKANVHAVVLVSTDKAVHPANIMGASKRLAEHVCMAAAAAFPNMHMVAVRFGNVLGSTGSVVPLFYEQLKARKPLTVTHPDMERYFMTIREAAGLVIQAAALSDTGRSLYILDMGKPIKIVKLAEQMILLAGYKPYEEIPINFTGLRTGEKLTEELIYADEHLQQTMHPRIRKSQQPMQLTLDNEALSSLETLCHTYDHIPDTVTIRTMLQKLVPEYQPLTKEL